MIIKFLFEDGAKLSKYKQAALMDQYKIKGVVTLPDGMIIKSIQGMPPEPREGDGQPEHTTIIIIGRTL